MHARGRRLAWLLCVLYAVPVTSWAGPLIVAAALDRPAIAPLLAAFERARPGIVLHYDDLSTTQVDIRLRNRDNPPDVVISSAMPAQLAAVNAGFAQPLTSAVTRAWPARFKWRNAVFGFTFEPVVFAYRRELAGQTPVPESHGALYDLLARPDSPLAGRVATYDPVASAVGYALYQADADYTARFWQLVAAMGRAGATPEPNTRAMLRGLSSGRYLFAYNLIGSYAMRWAATHPDIVVAVPDDYALVLSRLVFVHRAARHPAAARAFVDFLLGPVGQRILARRTPLYSLRGDVTGRYTARRLKTRVGDRLMPIAIDAGLLALTDPQRRADFLARWRQAFRTEKTTPASPSAAAR